jgi:hypothetical protein
MFNPIYGKSNAGATEYDTTITTKDWGSGG